MSARDFLSCSRRVVSGLMIAAIVCGTSYADPNNADETSSLSVSSVELDVKKDGRELRLDATMAIRNPTGNRRQLIVPIRDFSVVSVDVDGKPAILGRSKGKLIVWHTASGKSRLQLKLRRTIERIGDDLLATIPQLTTAPTNCRVHVDAGEHLLLNGRVLKRPKPAAEKCVYEFPAGNLADMSLRMTKDTSPKRTDSLRTAGSVISLHLKDGLASWESDSELHVAGTPIDSLTVTLPAGMKITRVSSPELRAWTVSEPEDSETPATLKLAYRRSWIGKRGVHLQGLLTLGAESFWSMPKIGIADFDGHTGRIEIHFPDSMAVRPDEFTGLREVVSSTKRLGRQQGAIKHRTLAFQFWTPEYELALVIPRQRFQATARCKTELTVEPSRCRMSFESVIAATHYPSWLTLEVPADWSNLRMKVNGRKSDWRDVPAEAGVRHVEIQVPAQLVDCVNETTLRIELSAMRTLERDDKTGIASFPLPEIRFDGTRMTTGTLTVDGADNVDFTVSERKNLQAVRSRQHKFRYTFNRADRPGFGGVVTIRPRTPRLKINELTVLRVDELQLHSEHVMRLNSSYGHLDVLDLELPVSSGKPPAFQWNGGATQLIAAELKQKTKSREYWRVRFNRPITEIGTLKIELTTQIGETDGKRVPLPQIQIPAAAQHTRLIAAVGTNGHSLHLVARSSSSKSEIARIAALARADIPTWIRSHISSRALNPEVRAIAVYPGAAPGNNLRLQISPLTATTSSTPVIRRLEMKSKLSPDGALTSQAIWQFNAAAGSILGINIPPDVRLISIAVNGDESAVRMQKNTAVISLPRDGSHSFDVQLHYRSNLDRPSGTGKLEIQALTLLVRRDDASWNPLPVKQRTWTLRYPRSISIIGVNGAYQTDTPLERTAWLMSELRLPIDRTATDETAVLNLRGTDEPGNVTLSYESHTGGWLLRLAAWFAAMLVLWRGRKLPLQIRGPIALAIVVSVALLTLWGSPTWDPCLDGLLAGTLCGSLLWIVPTLVARIRTRWTTRNASKLGALIPGRVVAGMLAFSVLHLVSGNAVAEETTATVSAAEYHVSVAPRESKQHNTANVQATFAIHCFSDEAVTLALPLGPVPMQSATIDGKPAVVSSRNGQLLCVVPKKGRNQLKLTFSVPMQSTAGSRSLSLPLRPVPSGKVLVRLPAAESYLTVDGLTAESQRFQDKNNAGVMFSVDQCRDVVLTFSAKPLPPVTASVETRCRSHHAFSETGITQRDELTLKVVGGSVREWLFQLPAETLLTGIRGSDVAEWRLEDGEDRRRVRVSFRRPVTSTTVIEFLLHRSVELSEEISQVTLDRVVSLKGKTQNEVVSVSSQAGIELKESSLREATRIQPNAIQRVGTSSFSPLYAYRLLGTDSQITLGASRPRRQAVAVALHRVRVAHHRIHVASRFHFEISGSPRSKLTLFLPEGFSLNSLHAGKGSRWSFGEEGTMVFVTFDKPRIGPVAVDLTGSMRRDASAATAEVVIPSSLDAGRISNIVGVQPTPGVALSTGEIEGWKRRDFSSLTKVTREFLGKNPAFVFLGTQVEPVPVGLKLTPENGPIHAETETIATISTDAVKYSIVARWSGITGSSRVVALTVPNWMAEQIRFKTDEKLQVVRDLRDDVPEGRTRWIVTDFADAGGDIVVLATAIVAPALTQQNQVHVPDIVLEQVSGPLQTTDPSTAEFKPIERPYRFVGFVNRTSLELVAPNESKHRPVDPEMWRDMQIFSVPDDMRIPRVTHCYELAADSDQLTWQLRTKPTPIGADAVTTATLLTALHADGSYRLTAVYKVKQHSREFLPLTIPAGLEIETVRVGGKLTRAVTTGKAETPVYLIPISQAPAANAAVEVHMELSGRVPGGIDNPLPFIGRTANLPAPRIVSWRENPQIGMTVGQTKWAVRVPDGVHVTPLLDQGESNVALETQSHGGRELSFDKAGGAPQLVLATRTEQSTRMAWRLIATLLWLAVGAIGWLAVRRGLGQRAGG